MSFYSQPIKKSRGFPRMEYATQNGMCKRPIPGRLKISAETRWIPAAIHKFGIAGVLKEAGVVTGAMVGVLLDRSPDMIAALFGIWKAGGVYIPLDLAAPLKRLAFMLEDSAPPLKITQRKIFF